MPSPRAVTIARDSTGRPVTRPDDLRDAVDNRWPDSYGYAKDFAWGSVGLCFNF